MQNDRIVSKRDGAAARSMSAATAASGSASEIQKIFLSCNRASIGRDRALVPHRADCFRSQSGQRRYGS
jgi:hypothetical protein